MTVARPQTFTDYKLWLVTGVDICEKGLILPSVRGLKDFVGLSSVVTVKSTDSPDGVKLTGRRYLGTCLFLCIS